MGTHNTSELLKELEEGQILRENLDQKRLTRLVRLKEDVPFSKDLNEFIENRAKTIPYAIVLTGQDVFKGLTPTEAFQALLLYAEKGVIPVWTGESDRTIFGSSRVNHLFRFWHDYIHIKHRLGFDLEGESIVAAIQQYELPQEFIFEKELIHIEVVGQAQYYFVNSQFHSNQREFTIEYLNNPSEALLTE